jgi:hypothetical protein
MARHGTIDQSVVARSRPRHLSFERLEERRVLASFTGSYAQDFDALPSTGDTASWVNGVTLPGWYLFRRPAPGVAIDEIGIDDGRSNTGSFYSYGDGDDRALGGLGSGGAYFGSPGTGAVAGWMAVALTNDMAISISQVHITYRGEQWRNSGAELQAMEVEYGVGPTFDQVANWTAAGLDLNFTSPVFATSGGKIDGNAPGHFSHLAGSLAGLDWRPGETLWLRWVERNDSGSDHALAIDDFRLSLLPIHPGDFNNDGRVDAADYVVWRNNVGALDEVLIGNNGDGVAGVGIGDYLLWKEYFGATYPYAEASLRHSHEPYFPPAVGNNASSPQTTASPLVPPVPGKASLQSLVPRTGDRASDQPFLSATRASGSDPLLLLYDSSPKDWAEFLARYPLHSQKSDDVIDLELHNSVWDAVFDLW